MFLHKNIFCDPPLEPSHRDGTNEGSQHNFTLKNKKNYLSFILNTPCIPLIAGPRSTVGRAPDS